MARTEKFAQRLIDLLSKGWDSGLTEAEHREIEDLCREHGTAGGEVLLNASTLHLGLNRHIALAKLHSRVMEQLTSSCEAPAGGDAGLHERLPKKKTLTATTGWIATLAASLLLVLSFGVSQWWQNQPSANQLAPRVTHLLRPSRPVGSLVTVHQALWAEGSRVVVGENIEENRRLELLSGSAQLSMACGADIVLQGPCSIQLVSEDYARLESGKVTAQVAKWGTGFTISAKDLEITDLGTRFALSADDQGVVEAHVLEGSVLAEPLKQRRPNQSSMLLKSGQAIRVDGVRSQVDLIDARRQDFVDQLQHFRPLRPITIWNTGVGAASAANDPHWRIVSGCEEHGAYPRPAVITIGDVGSYEDNKPDASQWISVEPEGYPGVPPESTHTFETTFDLTGFDIDTVYVVGYFLVDDAIDSLRINGHPVEFKRWATTWDVYDFRSFHPIEITDHFVEGENTISIDVFNSPSRPDVAPDSPNPMALRVEWQAFGCALESAQ